MTTLDSAIERENQPGTPRFLRTMNERVLLEHLRQRGPMSRAQLARETGLSKPTVSQALANLERVGLVRIVGQCGSASGGRQAILYEPDPQAGYVVGIDIGRSWLRVATADLAGHIVSRCEIENKEIDADALVDRIIQLAHSTVVDAGLNWSQVIHTVIGSPGVFDPPGGRLLFASNLPGWGRPGLIESLQAKLRSSITIENDANLAALGEKMYGSGTEADTLVFLTVGTGIGMGIIMNGTIYHGAHGAGGEIAFLPFGCNNTDTLSDDHRVSQRGMLEEAAAAEGIVRTAQKAGMSLPLSSKQIFDAARNGDERALTVIKQEGELLAEAIAAITAILDPALIVIGGGIGRNIDLLQGPLEQHLYKITRLHPPIAPSKLGEDAVLMGALATALEVARNLIFQQRATD